MRVEFETAKLAKEKGFNWETLGYFTNKYSTREDFSSNYNGKGVEHWTSQPSQSLLQKWLREVHDIHIWCEHQHKNLKNVYGYRINGDVETSPLTYSNWTYEQALEAGLQEALNLV